MYSCTQMLKFFNNIRTLNLSLLLKLQLFRVKDLSCFLHRSALCHVHQQSHSHVHELVAVNCLVETTPVSWSAMLSPVLVIIKRYSVTCI